MKFRNAGNALKWYFRETEALAYARGVSLGRDNIQDGGRRERREARQTDVLAVAECLVGLEVVEKEVLRLTFQEGLSLAMIRVFLEERYPDGVEWTTRAGARSRRKNFADEWIIEVRRLAEAKVERELNDRRMMRG